MTRRVACQENKWECVGVSHRDDVVRHRLARQVNKRVCAWHASPHADGVIRAHRENIFRLATISFSWALVLLFQSRLDDAKWTRLHIL